MQIQVKEVAVQTLEEEHKDRQVWLIQRREEHLEHLVQTQEILKVSRFQFR